MDFLGKCDNKSFVDNEQLQLTQIAIECRTVRIGSYKYYPREKVAITHNGIRFSVPLLEDGKLPSLIFFYDFTERL